MIATKRYRCRLWRRVLISRWRALSVLLFVRFINPCPTFDLMTKMRIFSRYDTVRSIYLVVQIPRLGQLGCDLVNELARQQAHWLGCYNYNVFVSTQRVVWQLDVWFNWTDEISGTINEVIYRSMAKWQFISTFTIGFNQSKRRSVKLRLIADSIPDL